MSMSWTAPIGEEAAGAPGVMVPCTPVPATLDRYPYRSIRFTFLNAEEET